ncbi:hypothetical protein NHX12_011291 [Muraenolepis orangiensis]|uniref:Uncharacterized protein n=1 Tax=Muraenolepis orangiensis TaxID=630683 RepID=A0A9Q0I6J0_9TELE|nr:hypothetical protein NHX12_011291 [Muraenolepis orangiensis]
MQTAEAHVGGGSGVTASGTGGKWSGPGEGRARGVKVRRERLPPLSGSPANGNGALVPSGPTSSCSDGDDFLSVGVVEAVLVERTGCRRKYSSEQERLALLGELTALPHRRR